VQIYSGGLGVLSGDHIKSASGLGIPLIAIGLFYDQGYFKQHLDINGWQHEEYLDTKVENLPMEPVLDDAGKQIVLSVDINMSEVFFQAWRVNVGRVPVYLIGKYPTFVTIAWPSGESTQSMKALISPVALLRM